MYHLTINCTQDSTVCVHHTVYLPFDICKEIDIIDEKITNRLYHRNCGIHNSPTGITSYISQIDTETKSSIDYSTNVKAFLEQISAK